MAVSSSSAKCEDCGAPIALGSPLGQCPNCLLQVAIAAGGSDADRVGWWPPEVVDSWFADLEVTELLGTGGTGAVYLARQVELGRPIALKIVPLEQGDRLISPERLTREAQALARLGHPRIVTIYEVRRLPEQLCLLMEYVEGGVLRQQLRAGPLAPTQAVAWITQVCEGLEHAHAEGVIHRDVKPENVLLTAEGCVKIADFGLAKLASRDSVGSPTLTRTGQAMGSAHYVAPEQLAQMAQVDGRADLYSLGVMLYEMLTGTLPSIDYQPPSHVRPLDPRLDHVVQRLLRRDPEARYLRASDVARALREIASNPPTRRRFRARSAVVGATIAGAIALVPLVGFELAQGRRASSTVRSLTGRLFGQVEARDALAERTAPENLAALRDALDRAYIDLKNPTTSYHSGDSADGLSLVGLVDGVSHAGGWGLHGGERTAQAAVVQTVAPVDATQLVFEIENDGGGYPGYKPQRFRLYFTQDSEPSIDAPKEIWTPLRDLSATTSHPGSHIVLEDDGLTLRALGSPHVPDDYLVTAEGTFRQVTGFKLELLPGSNGALGFGGPTGAAVHVTEFEVLCSPPPRRPPAPQVVQLVGATATYSRLGAHGVDELVDGNLRGASFWLIGDGAQYADQVAVVRPREPLTASSLVFELMQNGELWHRKLQRFRISVTNDPEPTADSPSIQWLPVIPQRASCDPPGPELRISGDGYIDVYRAEAIAQCSILVAAPQRFEKVTGIRLEAVVGAGGTVGFPVDDGDMQLSEFRVLIPATAGTGGE